MIRNRRACSALISAGVQLAGCLTAPVKFPLSYRVQLEQGIQAFLQAANRELDSGAPDAHSRASALLGLAYELSPGDERVLDGFGCIALREGKYADASSFFRDSLRHNPGYDPALFHLGMVQEVLGDRRQAEVSFRGALALNPLNAGARAALARLQADPLGALKAQLLETGE